MDTPHVGDAALALASVAVHMARLPLHVVERLPGMRRLAWEGATVRARLRSRLEGVVEDVLRAPEVERALDRAFTVALEHETMPQLVEAVLASPGLDRIRAALTDQTATLAEQVVAGTRSQVDPLDDGAERARGWRRRPRPA